MRILELNEDTKKDILSNLLKRSPNSYGEYEGRVNAIIENVKANDANVIETLRSLYDEIVYDAKNEYKFHGLVDMDAHNFTDELGMVYIDKDNEVFYENSIHPTDFAGVSPDKYYSKKRFSIVDHFPGILQLQITKVNMKSLRL